MKRHDRNAMFVLLLSNSLIAIETYFIVNTRVPGRAATTALYRSPIWTPTIEDSVYNSFLLPFTMSNLIC